MAFSREWDSYLYPAQSQSPGLGQRLTIKMHHRPAVICGKDFNLLPDNLVSRSTERFNGRLFTGKPGCQRFQLIPVKA